MMKSGNGITSIIIAALVASVLSLIGSYYFMAQGKCNQADCDAHATLPAHYQQQVLNAKIEGRLVNLEFSLQRLEAKIEALPERIVEKMEFRNERSSRNPR
jgi:hypothetical protein